jgi:hypothetical protein
LTNRAWIFEHPPVGATVIGIAGSAEKCAWLIGAAHKGKMMVRIDPEAN